MEKPPEMNGTHERESISDERCVEAMRSGDFEVVREWYARNEVLADASPSQQARLDFQIRYAKLQFDSGVIDEDTGESYAIATLEAVRDAYPKEEDEAAHRLQAIIDQMRGL
ncbi:MAG: hypothetical protein IT405_02410 [Candidatus Yanofskybacteria bacterium]|nr:hypothetical protein [Candidatus Yanofskybacteria bacterium]